VTTWAPTPEEAAARMHRALREFRIRAVVTNLRFLDQVITHPKFAPGDYTSRFIDTTPELFAWPRKRDRATRMLAFLAETIANGNPEVAGLARELQAAGAQGRARQSAAGRCADAGDDRDGAGRVRAKDRAR
jgi:pyruvate carboxylase